MFPESILTSDPAMDKLGSELACKRICRLCLCDVGNLVDIDAVGDGCYFSWKMKIASCFSMATISSGTVPKFICEACCSFVEKSFEFKQLCSKSELMLIQYQLTGRWAEEIKLPVWLHSSSSQQEATGNGTSESDKNDECHSMKKRKVVRRRSSSKAAENSVITPELSLQSPTITPGNENPMLQQYPTNYSTAYPLLAQQLGPPMNSSAGNFPYQNVQIPPMYRAYTQNTQQVLNVHINNPSMVYQPQPPPPYQGYINQRFMEPTTIVHPRYTTQPNNPPQRPLIQQPQLPPPAVAARTHPNPKESMGDWCRVCPCRFASSKHLKWHMRRHSNQRLRSYDEYLFNHPEATGCWLCCKVFDTHQQLLCHLEQHAQVGLQHACDFCLLIFTDKDSWVGHVRFAHPKDAEETLNLNRTQPR